MNTDKRRKWILLAALWGFGLLLLAGCTDTTPTAPASQGFRLTPGNQATGVALDASVTLSFATTVDHATAEQGMHLIAEPRMYDPDPTMGDPGSMEQVMMDPDMMQHMDQYHSTPGHFTWDGTVCTFHPDSLLMSQTRYMVHLSGSMVHMVPGMGGMRDDYYTNRGGDMMTHFNTVSASSARE